MSSFGDNTHHFSYVYYTKADTHFMKAKIKLPLGFRFLNKNDNLSSFNCGTPALDDYIRENASNWIDDPAHLVIVHVVKKKICGLMDLEIYAGHVELAVLARNMKVRLPEDVKVGSRLARLAENISKQLGKKEIRLEAMQDSHDWWNDRMDYEQYGQKYAEPTFGELTPKRKFLQLV